jgi:hypothetical protein
MNQGYQGPMNQGQPYQGQGYQGSAPRSY